MRGCATTTLGIDYVEAGSGTTVLFIPGSYSTHAAWRPIQKLLPPSYRNVGTSLCGYGATSESRTRADTGMHHELRIIEQVAHRAGGPVHLVGHSFGGTVALAAALANSVDVASLALFEANPLALIRQLAETLYKEVLKLSHEFEAAVDAGDVDAAAWIIDFWGGRGTFDAMPEAVRNYCRQTAPVNVFDWRTDFGFQADSPDYAAIDVPVLLVRGTGANPAMVTMTEALVQALPDVRSRIVPGAGHFLITTHARECAALLAAFLNDAS